MLINGNTLPQETLRQRLRLLTEEKADVQSQLMDCHLRAEQEGKVMVSAVPVVRGMLCRVVEGHNVFWFSFTMSYATGFKFFQVINISVTNEHH